MGIVNKTTGSEISSDYLLCSSFFSKIVGLMFSSKSKVKKNALLFEFRYPLPQSIHMFFVFYSIDVVFLDDKQRVVDLRKNLKPFCIYNSWKKSKYVLELPQFAIEKNKICVGDVLNW